MGSAPKQVKLNEETGEVDERESNDDGADVQGPDRIKTTNDTLCWKTSDLIKIDMNDPDSTMYPPISVPSIFNKAIETYGDRAAFEITTFQAGLSDKISYKQYGKKVEIITHGLLYEGLKKHNFVWIFAENGPDWAIVHVATIIAGGIAVSIYPGSTDDELVYFASNTSPTIIFLEGKERFEQIWKMVKSLTNLIAIISFEGYFDYDSRPRKVEIYSLDEFRRRKLPPEWTNNSKDVLNEMAVNECCSIVYTSGTFGEPKPVMLCQDNIITTAKGFLTSYGLLGNAADNDKPSEFLSNCTYAHATNLVLHVYGSMIIGGTLKFLPCPVDSLHSIISSCESDYRSVFMAPSRAWHAMFKRTKDSLYSMKEWKMKFSSGDSPLLFCIGCEPIELECLCFFRGIDINVHQLYAMTECSGVHLLKDSFKEKAEGAIESGFDVTATLASTLLTNHMPSYDEIGMVGRHIFMGYFNNKLETERVKNANHNGIDHSDDMGKIEQGFLQITGRKANLHPYADGKYVFINIVERQIAKEFSDELAEVLIYKLDEGFVMLMQFREDPMPSWDVAYREQEIRERCDQIGSVIPTFINTLETPVVLRLALHSKVDFFFGPISNLRRYEVLQFNREEIAKYMLLSSTGQVKLAPEQTI